MVSGTVGRPFSILFPQNLSRKWELMLPEPLLHLHECAQDSWGFLEKVCIRDVQ